jgi:hypothetical protein
MCRSDERIHKHHIIPRYTGGSNEPENLVEVTITQHAMFHFCNYQLSGNEEDRIAWKALSGQITINEAKLEAQVLGCKKSGKKHKENKTGIFGMTLEEKREISKKGGKKGSQTQIENNIGIFGMDLKQKSEIGKKAAQTNKENKTGIFGMTPYQKSEASKKAGQKCKKNKTGIFGMTPDQKSGASKKGGKITTNQKWQCSVTGYISNAGALSLYQRKRGIDTSNRIRIQ